MVVFLYIRTSAYINEDCPFYWLFNQMPNLRDLKVFRSMVFPNVHELEKNNFGYQSESHMFLGCPRDFDDYLCFHPDLGKIRISKDDAFIEDDFDLNPGLRLQLEKEAGTQLEYEIGTHHFFSKLLRRNYSKTS